MFGAKQGSDRCTPPTEALLETAIKQTVAKARRISHGYTLFP